MKKIELSLAACRVVRPVFLDPITLANTNLASKILKKQMKKRKR